MTPDQLQHFDELILKAVQSGKQETSALVADIIKRIEPAIEKSINSNVNGKINNLTQMMSDQNAAIHLHFDKVDAHMVKVEEYLPYMKALASVSDGGKILGKFVIFFGAVGAAVLAIRGWIK